MALHRIEFPPGVLGPRRIMAALASVFDDPDWIRRTELRLPYFGPVSVGLPNESSVSLPAFARDLSPGGIGLVHLMPIAPGEVTVALPLPSGKPVQLVTRILWCRDFGDGWYTSGGRFLDVAP
jgi:hypothetical protein